MGIFRVLYVGVTTVRAEDELDAEECFSSGDVLDEQIDVLSIREVRDGSGESDS